MLSTTLGSWTLPHFSCHKVLGTPFDVDLRLTYFHFAHSVPEKIVETDGNQFGFSDFAIQQIVYHCFPQDILSAAVKSASLNYREEVQLQQRPSVSSYPRVRNSKRHCWSIYDSHKFHDRPYQYQMIDLLLSELSHTVRYRSDYATKGTVSCCVSSPSSLSKRPSLSGGQILSHLSRLPR